MNPTDICSMTAEELKQALAAAAQPSYRVTQVYAWLHQKGVSDFDEMTDQPKSFRQFLREHFSILGCGIEKRLVSAQDGTVKYLNRLHDGAIIESVLMRYQYGYTLCISSQVGCKMGCSFCASAIGGFVRNLSPSEMLGQIHAAQRDRNVRVSHIVLMGMGEPLDNYENVLRFLQLATDEKGLNLSMRSISLSTCGIVPGIQKLMADRLQLTLSVSLHAPNDTVRSRIMPVNRRWGVDELLNACRSYAGHTSRRISFEYAMIQNVNDSDKCAMELARRLRGMLCHVNLIPANEVGGNDYRRSPRERLERFARILERQGIQVTVRRTLGADINASCGQLRRGYLSRQREENV